MASPFVTPPANAAGASGAAVPAPRKRAAWPVWLVVGVVEANLALMVVATEALRASRTQYQLDAQVTTQNLARLFEGNIRASFERIDLSLRLLGGTTPLPVANEAARRSLRAVLESHVAAQPDVRSLQIFDANGDAVTGTNLVPGVPLNVRAREIFLQLQASETAGLVVSKPLQSAVDGRWVLVLARRLPSPDGSFRGIASASVSLDHFDRLFERVDIGEHGAIAVRDLDNGLVARRPEPEQAGSAVGDQRISPQAREALRKNPAYGTFTTVTVGSDSIERSVSYRRVEGYPFYVIVGLGTDDFLAGWFAELRKASVLLGLFAAVTISLALLLAHFWRQRESELAASLLQAEHGRDRFARLFHGAPASTLLLSLADKRIVDVNESFCQRYGVTREEAVGARPMDLGIGPIEQDRAEFWRQLTVEGRVRNLVSRVRLKNGEGERCALAISLDITEMRQSERAREALAVAEAANRAKTEFLSRMSHELRTPLNAVIGFSELLRDEAGDRLMPPERAQLEHIHQAGWYLLTLTNEVLDISRIEAGQFHVDLRPLALVPLLGEAMQLSRSLASQHAVALAPLPPEAASLAVVADPVRLQQVVLNLFSNAIKYNRPGGTVHIEAAIEAEGQVRLEVIDDGLGMTSDQLEHLFEPFNRLGRERGTVEGAGVGLALTRQLMRLMHGRISITSEDGRGTRACIWLPAAALPEHDKPAAAEPGDAQDLEAVEPCGTVLYVEDNPVNALLVEQLLARWPGVRFVQAEDGESGLALARSLKPDLLLLDMQLPDIDGAEVLRRLRTDEATRSLRVVALSANAMAEDVARARKGGASDYWTKPIDTAHFLSEMRALLAPQRS